MKFFGYLNRFSPNSILVFSIIWFVFPFIILGKYSYIAFHDNFEVALTNLVSLGNLGTSQSAWNTLSASGMNVSTLGFVGIINRYIFAFLPGWLAYQILVFIEICGAILGSYFLCKKTFGHKKFANLLPGILFGMHYMGTTIHSLYFHLPVLLLALTIILNNQRSFLPWIFVILTTIWIAGTSSISYLIPIPSVLIIGWFLFIDRRNRIIEWIIIIVVLIALLALRFEDIIELKNIAKFTQMKIHRPLPTTADIFALPYFLKNPANIMSLGLFIIASIITKFRPSLIRRIAILLIIGIFAQPVFVALQLYLSQYLPFIQGFQTRRIAHAFEAFLWISSAYSIAIIFEDIRKKNRNFYYTGPIVLAMFVTIVYQSANQKILYAKDWVINGNYVLNLENPILKKLAKTIKDEKLPSRAEMVAFPTTILHPYGIETAGGYQPLYMRRYFEFWSTILEPLENVEVEKISQYNKCCSFTEWPYIRRFRLFLGTSTIAPQPEQRLSDFNRLNLLSLVNVKWILSRDKLTDPSLKLVYGDFKPWHSLTTREKIINNIKTNFSSQKDFFVYRNDRALPRFISPTRINMYERGRFVLDAMAQSTISDLENTLFVAKNELPEDVLLNDIYAPLTISPISYENDEIQLLVEGDIQGLLVGFNTWSPHWKVEIDRVPAKLFPADHTFWGVKIPKGKHKVVFSYIFPKSSLIWFDY